MTGVIIDGAVPRTPEERVGILVEYARELLPEARARGVDKKLRWNELQREYELNSPNWEWWHELEDDVLSLINDLLPEGVVCTLGIADPGDVIVAPADNDD